jgi:hypothetical protein
VDEDVGLGELEIPGIPDAVDDPDSLFEYDVSWTVSLVREGVSVLARAAGEAPEELLESAAEGARVEVAVTKFEAERVERDLRNMSRERLLPDEKTLEKIARYEAHLSRGSTKRCTNWRHCRRSEAVAPLLCPASTFRASKAKTAERTSPSRLTARACLITCACWPHASYDFDSGGLPRPSRSVWEGSHGVLGQISRTWARVRSCDPSSSN